MTTKGILRDIINFEGDMDVEVVRFPEFLNMPNLLLEDTESDDRFTLTIKNGVLTPVKIV